MKQVVVILVCLLMSSEMLWAGDGNHYDFTPKSPEAAAFNRISDIPMNNYTGSMSFSIPIYTLVCGDIQVPISLDYQGNCIPVSQEATWVGLNWLLNAGGAITATLSTTSTNYGETFKKDWNYMLNSVSMERIPLDGEFPQILYKMDGEHPDWRGNIIYDGDETMILNDVGYALYDKDNTLSFHYYLKDHLGNNRVVVSENGEIEQVNDYYPTGALMASSKGGDTQRFKYNGKELDRVNGLNWYDYGARNYDAAIVRWDGMDKLCEKYYPFTPYGYCCANFMNCIDLDGNELFLSGNYNQRLLILSYLNKLTNDNLVVDKNGIVSLTGKERWMNRDKKWNVEQN